MKMENYPFRALAVIVLTVFLSHIPTAPLAQMDPPPPPTIPTTFFGPKSFAKPASVSITHQESFPLLVQMPVSDPPASPRYSIQVKSGSAGLQRNTVAVKLNGVLVADSASLKNSNPVRKDFSPLATNHLEIILQGKDENTVDISVGCQNCEPVQVSSPPSRAIVSTTTVTVAGQIVGIFDPIMFIGVGGVSAPVIDNQFTVSQVPLREGLNDLTVHVGLANKPPIVHYHRVYYQPPATAQLIAMPDHGLAPFDVTLQAQVTNTNATTTTVECQGIEPVQVEAVDDAFMALMPTPGTYTCTLHVIDDQGAAYEDSVEIRAFSKPEMDNHLFGKWDGMREALISGHIEGTVEHFAISSRDVFRNQFTALASVLPQIGLELQDIRLVEMTEKGAIYDLRRDIDGKEYSFQVEFVKDQDGIWRLRTF
jgi:hypothetical protein